MTAFDIPMPVMQDTGPVWRDGCWVYTAADGHEVAFPTVNVSDLPIAPRRAESKPVDADLWLHERLRACWGSERLEHFAGCTMAALAAPQNVEYELRRFIEEFRTLATRHRLLLYGATGVGKTWAAAAAVNELLGEGYRCRLLKLEGLIRMGERESRAELARIAGSKTDLVMLDDFGSERATGFGIASTQYFTDELYERGVALIVTTNLTRDQLARPGSIEARRQIDRIKQRCKCVHYDGPNQRQRPLAYHSDGKDVIR